MAETNTGGEQFNGRRVYVAFRIIQIGAISECDQSFQARLDLFITWADSKACNFTVEDLKTYKYKHWEPMIRFSNADEFVETNRMYMVWPESGFIGFRSTIQGKFRISFDFRLFPFDVQGLCVELTMGRDRSTSELLDLGKAQFRCAPNMPNTMMKQHSAEWKFRVPRIRLKRTSQLEGVDGAALAQMVCVIPVERMYAYYLYNVYMVSAMMTLMGFGVFAIDLEKAGDRLVLSATLLLLIIVLKFTLLDHQPNIAYMTHLDKYLFATYCMFVLQYGHCAFVKVLPSLYSVDESDRMAADSQAVRFLFCLFVVVQVLATLSAWRCLSQRPRVIASFGNLDDALQRLLIQQGYVIKNGVLKEPLTFDSAGLELTEDKSTGYLLEVQRLMLNSWSNMRHSSVSPKGISQPKMTAPRETAFTPRTLARSATDVAQARDESLTQTKADIVVLLKQVVRHMGIDNAVPDAEFEPLQEQVLPVLPHESGPDMNGLS